MKNYTKAVPTLRMFIVLFVLILFSNASKTNAQNAPKYDEPLMNGVEYYEAAESNFTDGFEDAPLYN